MVTGNEGFLKHVRRHFRTLLPSVMDFERRVILASIGLHKMKVNYKEVGYKR